MLNTRTYKYVYMHVHVEVHVHAHLLYTQRVQCTYMGRLHALEQASWMNCLRMEEGHHYNVLILRQLKLRVSDLKLPQL